jgi:hypothetical protein
MADETTRDEEAAKDEAEGREPEERALAQGEDPLEDLGTTERATEAELFPPSQVPPPHVPEDDDERQPATFASEDAPWVGAEDAWRRGSATGLEQLKRQSMQSAKDMKAPSAITEEDEEFLIAQAAPLLPTLPPVPYKGMGLGAKIGIAAAVVIVIAAAGGAVYWMNQRFTAKEQELDALRNANREDVERLEYQIRELLDKGGAENKQRANELQVELDAARQQASAAAVPPVAEAKAAGDSDGARAAGEQRRKQGDGQGGEKGLDDNPYGAAPAAAGTPAAAQPVAPAAPASPPATAATGTAPAKGEQDDLLDNALSQPKPAAERQPKPQTTNDLPTGAGGLPDKPSRDQVKTAMNAVTPQVQKCGQGAGRVVISMTVVGATGRIQSAEPTGDAAGTPVGLCAARAVKLAKFSPFQQSSLLIKYPFDL